MNTIKIFLAESGRIADLHKDFPLYQGQYNDKLLNIYVPTSILAPQFELQHYIGQIRQLEAPTDAELNAFVLANTYPSRQVMQGDVIEFENLTTSLFYMYVYVDNAWTYRQVDSFGTFNNLTGTSIKIGMIGTLRNGTIYKSENYYMRYLKTLTYQNIEYALYERKLPQAFTKLEGQGQNAPKLVINVVNVDSTTDTISSIITSQTCSLDVMQSTILDRDEPIEESQLDEIVADINSLNAQMALKQDKTDELLETTDKTIVGAINEVKTEADTNAENIAENASDIEELQGKVETLENLVASGETFIGYMEGSSLPTATELNDFVEQEVGREPEGSDVIIFTLKISGETDKSYKYIYNEIKQEWSYYEIPAIEFASNTDKGIVQGNYKVLLNSGETFVTTIKSNLQPNFNYVVYNTLGRLPQNNDVVFQYLPAFTMLIKVVFSNNEWSATLIDKTQISISSGKTETVYMVSDIVEGQLPTLVVVRNAIISNQQTLANIINGTQTVGKATNTENDGNGDNIIATYLNRNVGATKQELYDYALPRTFNDVYFLTDEGYSLEIPTDTNPIYTEESTQIGDTELFSATRTITNAQFELSKKNSYDNDIFITASENCTVAFRCITEIYKNSEWVLLNSELTEPITMVANQIKKISFASQFNELDTIINVEDGDIIRQTVEVQTTVSTPITFNIYSNETYPSTFTLNTTSQIIYTSQGYLGELPTLNLTGTLDAVENEIVFEIPQSVSLENNVEYLIDLTYTGTVPSGATMLLKQGTQDIRLVTPYNFASGNATPSQMAQASVSATEWKFTGVIEINALSQEISVLVNIDNNDNFATKGDLNTKQDIIQYSTMPTASADNLGEIIQYTGATSTYKNGFFYKCVVDNNVYSWEEIVFGSTLTPLTNAEIDTIMGAILT